MTETWDPSNHLLAVAIVVFYWQLIRIWCQPPPPGGRKEKPDGKKAATWPHSAFSGLLAPPQPARRSTGAQPPSSVSTGRDDSIAAIRSADAGFDETAFLAGASLAYERVVGAYAAESLAPVDGLLDPAVLSDFEDAISGRRKRGERRNFTFVGLKGAEIVDAASKGGTAEISVSFTAEASSATWGADGSLLRGDPGKVVEVADIWTFSRRLAARDPNWTVIATEGA